MRSRVTRSAFGAAVAVAAVLCSAVSTAAANATRLQLYQKIVSIKVVNAAGQRVNPAAKPVVGDRVDEIDRIYAGTAAHHPKRALGPDHLGCVIVKLPTPVVCNLDMVLSGSMLVSDQFTVSFKSANPFGRIPIRDGTGKFLHAHGFIKAVPIGRSNNANLTAVFSTK